jgi:hypothetical protein
MDGSPTGDGATLHDGGTLPDGAMVLADGAVILPDGAVVLPDGSVIGNDSGTIGPDATSDGGVGPDAHDGSVVLPDGEAVAHVGTPCTTDHDCPGLFCSPPGSGFGYCSWVCSPTQPCPDGAVCATFSGSSISYCMERCDPAAPRCAMGYLCEPGIADAPVCYQGCSNDGDCPTGERCGMGVSGVRECYTPGATVGASCTSSGDCPDAGYCLDESSWGAPHGMCVTFCDLSSGAGCNAGSTCVAWGYGGAGSCVPTCDATHPCRTGYACTPTGSGGPNACVPRCMSNTDCIAPATCSFVTGRCSM